MNKKIKINIAILIFTLLFTSHATGQQPSSWHITVDNPENYVGISLANGRIGIMLPKTPSKPHPLY
jgi:hypothetical protein